MNRPTPEMEQRFSDWQRSLTLTSKTNQSEEDVTERQRELVNAVKGGSQSFGAYLRVQLGIEPNVNLEAPTLPRMIDPSELRDPPFELEVSLVEAWSDQLNSRDASQPLLWTRCHLNWIEQGHLGERLDEAFLGALPSGAEEKTTEAAARNLLRRMGGLPHVRGKVSVLSDCPFSRAWWRGRVAAEATASSAGGIDALTAHRVLHSNNDAWARLVGDSLRRITVANHAKLRAALIYQYRGSKRGESAVRPQEMQEALRLLARRSPAILFDALDWSVVCDLTAEAVAQTRADQQREAEAEEGNSPSSQATTVQRLTRFLRR